MARNGTAAKITLKTFPNNKNSKGLQRLACQREIATFTSEKNRIQHDSKRMFFGVEAIISAAIEIEANSEEKK